VSGQRTTDKQKTDGPQAGKPLAARFFFLYAAHFRAFVSTLAGGRAFAP